MEENTVAKNTAKNYFISGYFIYFDLYFLFAISHYFEHDSLSFFVFRCARVCDFRIFFRRKETGISNVGISFSAKSVRPAESEFIYYAEAEFVQ